MSDKRKRHRWDTPDCILSATCIKCGCRRFAEKFSGRMSWIYIQPGTTRELTDIPSCLPQNNR